MKKLIAVLLILTLVISFSACGKDTETAADTSVPAASAFLMEE